MYASLDQTIELLRIYAQSNQLELVSAESEIPLDTLQDWLDCDLPDKESLLQLQQALIRLRNDFCKQQNSLPLDTQGTVEGTAS